jgi:short subunit dehydrogenase-like uncharacterized protein
MSADRPFDVVLFGATGFTGKLVARYLAKHAPANGVRWGIAGRSLDKLESLRSELGLANLPLYVADSNDTPALEQLASTTHVVATTVGPYAKYGIPLAGACARAGTSYCDLAGEPSFIRPVIDQFHDTAAKTRARIVPASGYDSIPSDLGAYLAWDHARRRHGDGLSWVKLFTGRIKGAASGGTIASMFGVVDAAKQNRDVRRLLLDTHGLDPNPHLAPRDPFEDDQRGVRFDDAIGRWTAPFVMASVNSRIVRRSHALFREGESKEGYGPNFRYHEAMSFRAGPQGLLKASAVTLGLGGALTAAAIPPVRAVLERFVLPRPGDGPTQHEMDSGHFEMLIVAETESGKRLVGRVAGTSDPGYGETAKMLSEAAMCLAKDRGQLAERFGVLTPATAMGMRLIERLRAAGMTFDIADA